VARRCRDVCRLQTAGGRADAATCTMSWRGVDAHRSSLVASRWRGWRSSGTRVRVTTAGGLVGDRGAVRCLLYLGSLLGTRAVVDGNGW